MEEEDKIVDIDDPKALDKGELEGSKGPSYFKEMYDSLDFSENPYINNEQDDYERKKNYSRDITYATNSELGFDYLRDNTIVINCKETYLVMEF